MTYMDIKKLFNFDLPDYFERYFNDFLKQYNREEKVISKEELDMVLKETCVDIGCLETIEKIAKHIYKNDSLHIATMFFIYVTIVRRKPWQNYVHNDDIIKIEGYHKNTLCLLFVAKQFAYSIINYNPPRDLNEENAHAFKGYSSSFYEENGFWGMPSFNWNMQCAGGCMFKFGSLKFCPSYFTDDFPVLFNGKEYVTLAGGSWGVDKNHRLTYGDRITTTIFEENEKEIIAHRIQKNGDVDFEPTHFNKMEWKDFLRGDYHTLDIHIPSHIDYTPEVMKESYKKALEFYKTYYPDHKIKALAGYSWLFAPELKEVLKPDSKILNVQRSMYLMPTIGTFDETCEFIREGSSMYNNIKNAIAKGSKFHFGIMYVPVDEILKN